MSTESRSKKLPSAIAFSACIRKQRSGEYLVKFPDLPGCLTEGETLDEARSNAR